MACLATKTAAAFASKACLIVVGRHFRAAMSSTRHTDVVGNDPVPMQLINSALIWRLPCVRVLTKLLLKKALTSRRRCFGNDSVALLCRGCPSMSHCPVLRVAVEDSVAVPVAVAAAAARLCV